METGMMQQLLKAALLLLCTSTLQAKAQAQGSIVAAITGLKSDKGVCRACLFRDAASFSSGAGPVQCVEASISGKTARARFEKVPAGEYAIAVFHDANNNSRLDKNFMGIPREGYGASGNNLPFAAAPGFEENKFEVAGTSVIHLEIKIRHIGF